MADDQQPQTAPDDPFVRLARRPGTQQQAAPDDDPFVRLARQQSSQSPQQQPAADDDPFVRLARQNDQTNPQQASGPSGPSGAFSSDAEYQRMGGDRSFWTKPLTTSLLGWGEYRKEASPDTEYGKSILGSIERGTEEFASGLTSPFSLGLMALTGGLGGLAEGAAAEGAELGAGTLAKAAINPLDSAVARVAGRSAAQWLKSMAPEQVAQVAKAAGVGSKLFNAGFSVYQISGLIEEYPQLRDAMKAGDYGRAAELAMGFSLGAVATGLSGYHLVRSAFPAAEPIITKDQEIIGASEDRLRKSGIEADAWRRTHKDLIENRDLDLAARLYHDAGGDPATLEQWRQEVLSGKKIKPELKERYDALLKQAQNLPDELKVLSADLRIKYAKEWERLKEIGRGEEGSQGKANYSGQVTYHGDDESSGAGVAHLTKSPGFTKRASFDNIIDAVKAGYKPDEIGLAGAREQYIRDFGAMEAVYAAQSKATSLNHETELSPIAFEPAKSIHVYNRDLIPVKPGTDLGDVGNAAPAPAPAPTPTSPSGAAPAAEATLASMRRTPEDTANDIRRAVGEDPHMRDLEMRVRGRQEEIEKKYPVEPGSLAIGGDRSRVRPNEVSLSEEPSIAREVVERDGKLYAGQGIDTDRAKYMALHGKYEDLGPEKMAIEMVQNAVDAASEVKGGTVTYDSQTPSEDNTPPEVLKALEGPNGKLTAPTYIEIRDTGPGMSLKTFGNEFMDVYSTGKKGTKARGGWGVAKATFQLGGKYFLAETESIGPNGPERYRVQGTPEQIQNMQAPITKLEPTGQTGTMVRTYLSQDQAEKQWYARWYFDKAAETNRTPVQFLKAGYWKGESPTPIEPVPTTPLATLDLPNAKVELHAGPITDDGQDQVEVRVTNRGLHQFVHRANIGSHQVRGLPSFITADIEPKVEPGEGYPFTQGRERLEKTIADKINDFVSRNLGDAARKAQVKALREEWAQISSHDLYFTDNKRQRVETPVSIYTEGGIMRDQIPEMMKNWYWREYFGAVRHIQDWFVKRFAKEADVQHRGVFFERPGGNVTFGVNIPNPDDRIAASTESGFPSKLRQGIFLNPLGVDRANRIRPVDKYGNKWMSAETAQQMARHQLKTILHETAHYLIRDHGVPFESLMGQMEALVPESVRADFVRLLTEKISGGINSESAKPHPQFDEAVRTYEEAARAAGSSNSPLRRTGIDFSGGGSRPPNGPRGTENDGNLRPSGGQPQVGAPYGLRDDSEIFAQAKQEVAGARPWDQINEKTRTKIAERAEELKVEMRTAASSDPTAVRRPLVEAGNRLVAYKGKLYWDVTDYQEGPKAFMSAKYRTTDENGDPVFDKTPVRFHPDYVKAMKRAYEDDSPFRTSPILSRVLRASTTAKKSLLAFSPFHRLTEAERGIQLGLDFREALHPPPITQDSLAYKAAYGPKLASQGERSLASEGLSSGVKSKFAALLDKFPQAQKAMEDSLFGGGGYIDRLKAAAFEKVVPQMRERNPNWNEDQVQLRSAKLVDAAFGGLNWKMMGVSQFHQDLARMFVLAPDFTGSQVLFAKYGLQPGTSSIVRDSLVRIAAYNYGVARVLNMLTTGKPHWEHPFSVVSPDEKKTYSIRTMPADIAHLLTDPRGFIRNRMNPLLMRSAWEAIEGRDEQGKQTTFKRELYDLLRNVTPIAAQNWIPWFRHEDESYYTSGLRALGVNPEPNVSTAYEKSRVLASGRSESGPVDQEALERHQRLQKMEDEMRAGTLTINDLNQQIENGDLSQEDAKAIRDSVRETKDMDEYTARMYMRAKRLGIKDVLQIWDVATPQERQFLQPLLDKKGQNYLRAERKKKTPRELLADPTYQRLRREAPHVPIF